MNTPVYDFLIQYAQRDPVRLHMPGHKGRSENEKAGESACPDSWKRARRSSQMPKRMILNRLNQLELTFTRKLRDYYGVTFGRKGMFAWLRENGFLYSDRDHRNYPTEKYANA